MQKRNSEQLAWLIRRHGIEMTHLSGGSHIGAIMSVADIMAVLYADILHYRPEEPKWADRDRFILSKGHAGASVYAALAESGFFPVEELKTHYQNGSRLSGHVSHHLPGVDFSTGSLGHGLSAGAGMSLAAKQDKKAHRVWEMVNAMRAPSGRRHSWQPISGWIIWSPLWITTICRVWTSVRIRWTPALWRQNGAHLVGTWRKSTAMTMLHFAAPFKLHPMEDLQQ